MMRQEQVDATVNQLDGQVGDQSRSVGAQRGSLDLARIRDDFPSLAVGTAHFDSPGGTQTPRQVSEALASALSHPLSNRGNRTQAERNADQIVLGARQAMADLLHADPRGIVFGRSATALTFEMSRTLSRQWQPGDEVVVTRLDHDANIRPWVIAAEATGATVRWADFDPTTGELSPDQIAAVLSERTRLVAVTAASNLIGTMPDLPAIARLVHQTPARLYVDGVHYAAHQLVDLEALGGDFFVCSPYKFLGPHHGVLAADPALLETLRPDKLLPSSDTVPERFELGTLPYELLAGTRAAVDYLASLSTTGGSRRGQLSATFDLLHARDRQLSRRLETGLADLDGVTLHSRARRRTSTTLFSLRGHDSSTVADHLASRNVNAPAGHFYALEASRHLGLGDLGAIRAGIAPYTSSAEVDRLLAAVAEL